MLDLCLLMGMKTFLTEIISMLQFWSWNVANSSLILKDIHKDLCFLKHGIEGVVVSYWV